MAWRILRRKLREIDRHSRRVERNAFDRAQGAAFVLALVASPLVVTMMERMRVVDQSTTVLAVRIFTEGADRNLRARVMEGDERSKPWPGVTPYADVDFVDRTSWCGWPFATRDVVWPTETKITLFGPAREELRDQYQALAAPLAARANVVGTTTVESTHIVAWFFSIGVWWCFLTLLSAIVVSPLRLGWYVYRRGRTIVRQRRIDRSHCPNCGYNARESLLRGRCPECGAELYERPDVY